MVTRLAVGDATVTELAEPYDHPERIVTTTATSTHQTEISVDPHVPLVRITREFDAPPERVFRAHTDPDVVARWLGPRRHEMRIDHYDCRTGGSHRYVQASNGNELFVASGMQDGVREGYDRLDELLAG